MYTKFSVYLCIIRDFNKAIIRSVCVAAVNSISVTRVALPKLHPLISYLLEDEQSVANIYHVAKLLPRSTTSCSF